MPVLPNPDPQVWRMLLGDRADEILGRDVEEEDVSSAPDGSSNEAPLVGNLRAGRNKQVGSTATRQNRDADESCPG